MTGLIDGRVVDPAGRPVAGASVAIRSELGPHSDLSALTSDEGRFRLAHLGPGEYTITTLAAGRTHDTVVTVHDEQVHEITITVGQGVRQDNGSDARAMHNTDRQPSNLANPPTVPDSTASTVTIDTAGIDWHQVRLVRVSLIEGKDDRDHSNRREIFFSPTRPEPVDVAVVHREPTPYTVTIAFFLTGGLVQTIGPAERSEPYLSLEQAQRHG